jgi:hypothetical protein
MGNQTYFIDQEIRALTQLVSSVIQKRSSLNYQINQLKLALNSKKTCIETKKLRDLKTKNADLVVDIRETEGILERIKKIQYIKRSEKDFSECLKSFTDILKLKSHFLRKIEEDLIFLNESSKELEETAEEKNSYLQHLNEKSSKVYQQLSKNQKIWEYIEKITFEIQGLKQQTQAAQSKRLEITEKHFRMVASKRLKRKQTLVIPKLTTSAFLLRSKLLLKNEMIKQINDLKKDQLTHLVEIKEVQYQLISNENNSDFEALDELNRRKSILEKKILDYKNEIKTFCTSPVSPILPTKNDDSLFTEFDNSSENSPKLLNSDNK